MKLLATIVPWFGGSPEPLKRTLDSTKGISDETLIVHQQLFDDDAEVAHSLADKVETVDWNYCFMHGYGELPNRHGQTTAKWKLLLGTAETFAEELLPFRQTVGNSTGRTILRCNHHNDTNLWGRIWCPSAGIHWAGWIHEAAGDGIEGPVVFRMQDTHKEPHPDSFRNEVLKWIKTTSYNHAYRVVGENAGWRCDESERGKMPTVQREFYKPFKVPALGFADRGWLGFMRGSKEAILEFCQTHDDLISAALRGDRQGFFDGVKRRMDAEQPANGVNFNPQGEPTSGDETLQLT